MIEASDKSALFEKAKTRLRERLGDRKALSPDGELVQWTDNLVGAVDPRAAEAAYSADPDWRQDMSTPHSSAAMTANFLLPWLADIGKLSLATLGDIRELRLEVPAPTGAGGTPAFFDAFAETDQRSVGVEVKCLEYLRDPPENYRRGFEKSIGDICERFGHADRGWLGVANRLHTGKAVHEILFTAQLVKQAFALLNRGGTDKHRLLYLFWEPRDWPKYECFKLHRSELVGLQQATEDDRVELNFMSANDLLEAWQGAEKSGPAWLAEHIRELKSRYDLPLSHD